MTEKYKINLEKSLLYISKHDKYINFAEFGNHLWGIGQVVDTYCLDMYAKCASNWLNRLKKHGFVISHRPENLTKKCSGWPFTLTEKGSRYLREHVKCEM
ncbi:MAG: hypothetical protein IKO41_00340 [Lachnospiraceae bacterium]|nr:hypothetical protein [Lachnospiraceae bacterium]